MGRRGERREASGRTRERRGARLAPDGLVHITTSGLHHIAVVRSKGLLELLFLDDPSKEIQGAMDPDAPFSPVHAYAQALTLSLVFVPEPRDVLVIGLGAAAVQKALWRHAPTARLTTAEIDPVVLEVAREFFAFVRDERQSVILADGREVLAGLPEASRDMILVDAFRGVGFGPYRLATREFWELCRSRLAPGGVVAVNMLHSDSLHPDKVRTLAEVFDQVFFAPLPTQGIFFATNDPSAGLETFGTRAARLAAGQAFPFPFARLATSIMPITAHGTYVAALRQARVLTDGGAPPGYFESLNPKSTIFRLARPGQPCPCDSGRLFEDCHGWRPAPGPG